MIRLLVVVEGQTEEAFVKEVLRPHLLTHGLQRVDASLVGKVGAQKNPKSKRGGGRWSQWRKDLENHLGNLDKNLRVTTLFDLYGFPDDFPGYAELSKIDDTKERCDRWEAQIESHFNDRRLIPYVQRHEFEALVLASLSKLNDWLETSDQLDGLAQLQSRVTNTPPEDINDDPKTAPSKRLLESIPGYNKILHGPLAVEDTGLDTIRKRCPRFNAWLRKLEGLPESSLKTPDTRPQ